MYSVYKPYCIVTISSLAFIWCSKLYENSESNSVAFDLVRNAKALYEDSTIDKVLRFQNMSMAYALISHARAHVKDDDLQRETRINVNKLQRKIENRMSTLRSEIRIK